ncbi:MAG: hypothetical protein JJE30_01090 [Desulfuromonadales bacterium]|nr:hypothetical protein [Desulfuromonadales bacterium]
MLKRSLSLLTLLACMIPMVAFAGNISTRVMTVGGTISTDNNVTTQNANNGTVTKSFAVAASVIITPAPGYSISAVTLTGATPALSSPLAVPLKATSQSVTVSFAKQLVSVYATTTTGGTVYPTTAQTLQVGKSTTYTFTPAAGNSVVSISNLPVVYTLKNSSDAVVSLPYAGVVKATITVPASPVNLVGSFLSIVANAGAAQTILAGSSATLAGSSLPVADSYAWTQQSGPSLGATWSATGTAPTINFPVAGNYVLKLTATKGSDSATSTVTIAVNTSASLAAKTQCVNCHSGAGIGVGVYSNWSTSAHSTHLVMCYTCHVGANTGAHPGATPVCTNCHADKGGDPAVGSVNPAIPHKFAGLAATCLACHATSNDAHTVKPGSAVTLASISQADCATCHTGRNNSFITSVHFSANGTNVGNKCTFCHGIDGTTETSLHGKAPSCDACHAAGTNNAFEVLNATAPAGSKCQDCHAGGGHPHSIKTTTAANLKTSCVVCHAVGQKHLGDFVDDNNGVRAITTEFQKWSHHVTGVDVNDGQCVACHLEGKTSADGTKIVVDTANHMADATTHLRNADNDNKIEWNPAAPNHTNMDNFCMSCHDDDGAISDESVKIQTWLNADATRRAAGKTASASNPFGDTISNRYDKMQRPAVVDAKGQFATGNASHHAVRGAKYNKRSRIVGADARAMTAPEVATFTQNSSAVLYGKRTTIYDAGKFATTYNTLSPAPGTTDTTLGDDSVLHCGDCHTVGQFKASDVGVASLNNAVIGAHGSANEYMLRNSIGTDERHVGMTYSNVGTSLTNGNFVVTNPGSPYLVCFNCHANNTYNSIGSTGNSVGNHAGEYSQANRCNGSINTISFAGYTTSNGTEEPYAFRSGLGQMDYTGWTGSIAGKLSSTQTSDTDFSNLFGMQCANCHNSGPNNAFGGIHGSKVNVYSDANAAQQLPRRFLPGLGNTAFVPGSLGSAGTPAEIKAMTLQAGYSSATIGSVSDLNWEQRYLATTYNKTIITVATAVGGASTTKVINGVTKNRVVDNSGCYTIVPETGPFADPAKPLQLQPAEAPYSVSPAYEQHNTQTPPQPLFGEWGGCDDHRGNAHGKAFSTGTIQGNTTAGANTGWIDPVGGTVATGGAGVTRKVLRPVSY